MFNRLVFLCTKDYAASRILPASSMRALRKENIDDLMFGAKKDSHRFVRQGCSIFDTKIYHRKRKCQSSGKKHPCGNENIHVSVEFWNGQPTAGKGCSHSRNFRAIGSPDASRTDRLDGAIYRERIRGCRKSKQVSRTETREISKFIRIIGHGSHNPENCSLPHCA